MATRLTASWRRTASGRRVASWRSIVNRNPVSLPSTAEVEIPLTTSLNPKFWFGLPTYSRAQSATFTDFEWVIRTAVSGEARFEWARRVKNLFTYSQELTNVAWTASASTIALHTETINGIPTYKLSEDTTTAVHRIYQVYTFVSGTTYIASYYVKQGTLQYAQIYLSGVSNDYANFDIANGTVTAGTAGAGSITALSNGWYRISLKFVTISGGSNVANLVTITSWSAARGSTYLWTSAYFYATSAQLEDVTGQSTKTVWEYISSNVLSSPFHGAMVDGTKYFDTDLLGNKLSPKGYYAEGARTNLFLQSNTFTTTWTKSAAQLVITANSGTSPDGSNSMWKLSPWAGAALQSAVQAVTVAAYQYAFSVYAKAGENAILQLLSQGTLSTGYVNFDLSDGTIGASSLWTGSIESVGNGIYRCTAITDTLVAWTGSLHISQVPTKTTGRAGNISWNGSDWLYIFGAQVELWSFPSTYIPTTTATVTRNADVLSYNVANAQSNYWAAFIDINLRYLPTTGVDRRAFWITGNTNNRMQIIGTTLWSQLPHLNMWNGSTVLAVNVWALSANTQVKLAAKWVNWWAGNLFQWGVKSSNLASPQAVATQFDIGNVWGAPLYGTIRNVKLWKQSPTDAELLAITSN